MILAELLGALPDDHLHGVTDSRGVTCPFAGDRSVLACCRDVRIRSVHYRAQEVQTGGLFVAVSGEHADGHDYIPEAVSRGAAAVVVSRDVVEKTGGLVVVRVSDSRYALAALSSRFYGDPSEKMMVIGITGTNGKTTTAFLIEKILSRAGFSVGVIGTLNYRYNHLSFDNPMTTPESLDLQRILADMREAGVTHVVMEVSSHSISLQRIGHCWMNMGIFTNLTQDHLDFHGNMEAYWEVKKKLFDVHLMQGPKQGNTFAIVNGNDPKGRELFASLQIPGFSTGFSEEDQFHPVMMETRMEGSRAVISTPFGMFPVTTPLIGDHNMENILEAAAACAALQVSLKTIREGIESVTVVPGRLERVPNDRLRHVFVDYAHTPDALQNVLTALRKIAVRRMICVFGCGGDRDREKRPLMGQIAARQSDLVVVTSDNPRSEDPLEIIHQVESGVRMEKMKPVKHILPTMSGRRGYLVEPDRRKAIGIAIRASRVEDVVLIAGKGHEAYQIVGKEKIPFDDREVALVALATETVLPRAGVRKKRSIQPKVS